MTDKTAASRTPERKDKSSPAGDAIKRGFDIAVSIVALALLSPLLLLVAAAVAWKMGWPVFFTQTRVGRGARLFRVIKFRTMLKPAPGYQTDAERLTRFGRWLRSTSLDELPELWNVLTGDMSLVGPRPLLVEYIPLYSSEQARRHEVRPGITGWAQINGRNAIDWEQRFELDVWYVDHRSLWLDIRILFMTVGKILKREGISAAGEATMAPFTGSQRASVPNDQPCDP